MSGNIVSKRKKTDNQAKKIMDHRISELAKAVVIKFQNELHLT
jgi:hypothetical protein